MSLIIPANSASAAGGYAVDNSCRFDDGSSDNLSRTFGTNNSGVYKWTYSFWIKRAALGTSQDITTAAVDGDNVGVIRFNSTNVFEIYDYQSAYKLRKVTNRVFRDTSAWYHIVISNDNSVASPVFKLFINGVQETSFSTDTNYAQNQATIFNKNIGNKIGINYNAGGSFFDGYISEAVFIDGLALDATSFGEFDEDSGIWKPIDVSGLTFGNNGFYLDFENSGALGADVSGNTNNFTVNNLTAIDQSTDTCTNNFATINSLDNYFYASTLSEGNLKQTCNSGNYSFNTSTFGLSQGKWYVEVKTSGSNMRNAIGIVDQVTLSATQEIGSTANGWGYQQGEVYNNNGVVANLGTFSSGNIVGIYLDLDNNKLYFAINGSIQNSGTGLSITAPASTTNGNYFFAFGDNASSNSDVNEVNFGSPSFTISSGNTDANGYGNFEYDPSSGTFDGASKDFLSLCTANLSEVLS